jgi:hypothetical protein
MPSGNGHAIPGEKEIAMRAACHVFDACIHLSQVGFEREWQLERLLRIGNIGRKDSRTREK